MAKRKSTVRTVKFWTGNDDHTGDEPYRYDVSIHNVDIGYVIKLGKHWKMFFTNSLVSVTMDDLEDLYNAVLDIEVKESIGDDDGK